MVAYQLTTEAGYSIAMGDPSYPCYRNFAYMVDCEALQIPLGVENGYCIEASALEEYDADVVHISSPSNPTGTLYPPEKLRSLCEECERRGISLISDELYHGLVYEGRAHSALEYFDDALVINGFSKYFCMPGLRLGWIIVPEKLCRAAEIIAQNLYISAPTPSQYAAWKLSTTNISIASERYMPKGETISSKDSRNSSIYPFHPWGLSISGAIRVVTAMIP